MCHRTRPVTAGALRNAARTRRGVSSVLAMMFLVVFGSLAATMAVVAQGNLRTADSHMRVNRAMSAAETGLVFASRRLRDVARRFVITKGVVDDIYGAVLWEGPVTADGSDADGVEILPPFDYSDPFVPASFGEALLNAHDRSHNTHSITVESGDAALPAFANGDTDILLAPPIALTANMIPDGSGGFVDGPPSMNGPYFRLKYQFMVDLGVASYVRVTSRGYDGRITRTLTMDYLLDKKLEFAVTAPNRIMIGKNVRIEGPLGTRYGINSGELDSQHGDPLVMRSDFYFLHTDLDAILDTFYAEYADHDVDGDGRLRKWHPAEGVGVTDGGGMFSDYDGNEYVDDFDCFLEYYDADGDGQVVYDAVLSGISSVEFTEDLQLANLIDSYNADRNGDGILGDALDAAYGYLDGIISITDNYAKVHGTIQFAITESEWNLANGENYRTIVHGPISAGVDESPVRFEVPDEELRELTTDMFTTASTWFQAQVPGDGSAFNSQSATQDGSNNGNLGVGEIFVPLDQMDSSAGTNWESIPFEAPGAYDYYNRTVYRNMRFENIRIPKGTNAMFENCWFIGVTFIEMQTDNIHENWNYVGAWEQVENPDFPDPGEPEFLYEEKYPTIPCELAGVPITDTKVESNNLRFHNCTVIGSIACDVPTEYTHWRNKIQFTGNTRFYIHSDDSDLLALPEPDQSDILAELAALELSGAAAELEKSSCLCPGNSIDIGNFHNDTSTAPTTLKGTIAAGILDVRGSVKIEGTLLNTQRSQEGVGPLFYGGLTDAFNTTIGYFGPNDGDGEGGDPVNGYGEIVLRYKKYPLPDGIPYPIACDPDPLTYWEGGDM